MKSLGATMTEISFDKDCYDVEVSAPDGKQFVASGATILIGQYWKHAPESKDECFRDIAERLGYGLEDLDHEL